MERKKYTAEQIIVRLCEAEVLCGQGKTAVRQAEIPEQTYCRWRKEYGGMGMSEAKQMNMAEKENACMKKIIAEQVLDIAIPKDVNLKTSKPGQAESGKRHA